MEVSLRLNDAWRVNGTYSYLDTNARAAFERGMHGDHGGSLGVTYRPSIAHEFTVAYSVTAPFQATCMTGTMWSTTTTESSAITSSDRSS